MAVCVCDDGGLQQGYSEQHVGLLLPCSGSGSARRSPRQQTFREYLGPRERLGLALSEPVSVPLVTPSGQRADTQPGRATAKRAVVH